MIWTKKEYTFGSIEYNFGSGVWRAECSLLIFHGSANSPFIVTIGSVTLRAVTDAAGDVMIYLTDILSVSAIGASGYIYFKAGESATQERIKFDIKGDLSPASMIIPNNGKISEYAPIIAPTCFLQGLFGIKPQFVLNVGQSKLDYVELIGNTQTIFSFKPNSLKAVSVSGESIAFLHNEVGGVTVSRTINIREQKCGRSYAMVQWVSATGLIKRHTFEVRDVETSVSDSVALQNNFGGFRELKGMRKGLRLHLPKITAYDYWYYSDIITSSDVRVAMSENDADFGEDTRVKVVTNSVTIPNGSSISDFDVDVIIKEYGII